MRAYQRKIIHLKTTGSDLFDEAYFLLSTEGEALFASEEDMVREANRIIDGEGYTKLGRGFFTRYKRRILCLALGALIGAALGAGISLLMIFVF